MFVHIREDEFYTRRGVFSRVKMLPGEGKGISLRKYEETLARSTLGAPVQIQILVSRLRRRLVVRDCIINRVAKAAHSQSFITATLSGGVVTFRKTLLGISRRWNSGVHIIILSRELSRLSRR